MNFCFIDVETTGRYADKHDVIQLACIPVINNEQHEAFNQFCQPTNWGTIEDGAIRVHGITRERMKTFQHPQQMLEAFIEYVRSFDCKFIMAGYNVDFDRQFLGALFAKCGKQQDFFSLFELDLHDTLKRARLIKNQIKPDNFKLETVANYFGIEIDAHDALSDIRATIEVDRKISGFLDEEQGVTSSEEYQVGSLDEILEPAQLHLHSMYGMIESIPSVKDWAKWCEANNVPGFSIVDHGSAISLYDMIRIKENTVPVPGVGLYFMEDDKLYPFNAWAISNDGYFNVMKLSSLGHDSPVERDGVVRPVLTREQIAQHKEGLVFGTGDVYGAIGECLIGGRRDAAEVAFNRYIDIFGENLFVEIMTVFIKASYSAKAGFQRVKRNETVSDGDVGRAYNRFMLEMADSKNIRVLPVSGAHFIDSSDKLIQDVISKKSYESGKTYIESYHAKTGKQIYAELKKQLGDLITPSRFNEWVKNTYSVIEAAASINIEFDYHLPKIDIPAHIREAESDYDRQTLLYTVELCKQHGRWNDDPKYVARFKKEIDVIMRNGTLNFLPYFLLYEDICSYARSCGVLQNIGRGSAGGCLLSYYLKIIHIDPIANNLPFERFLSVARINAGSFPDIDCDFGDRTMVIKYLEEKYGLGFAQICTFQRMKTKNAIKDAMRALYAKNGKDPNIEAVCKLIPDSPQGVDEHDFLYGYVDKEGEYHRGIIESVPEVAAFFKQFNQVEQLVKRLIGLVRGVGRHASAYAISTLDLASQRVPTMKIYDKHLGHMLRVTQYDASMVEQSGLVKADILGVTTIQAVSDCIDLIKQRTGLDYLEEDDNGVAMLYRLPEDESVYTDFYKKKTDSSFQFNTPLIKGYIEQFAPTSREHLSSMTALCRPGALDAPFVNDEISLEDKVSAAQYYMDVRNARRELSYLHPDLASCTSNGVFVYQEEVMKFLVDFAGYTLEESDRIRGAIAKKKQEVMMETFDRIRKSTLGRGWTTEQAQTVCEQVQAFARYSFNKSHSRCYSELGYITMYLKHHHKAEWWTAVLNNTPKEDKLRHYTSLLGDMVRSPSLATPSNKFVIDGETIVAPLSVLKRVGMASVHELVDKGPFDSLDDYIERVKHNKVNIGHFSSIIKGRAADCFMDNDIEYGEARLKLMEDYMSKRKSGSSFKEDMLDVSPINVFLMERETNQVFNKTLVADKAIMSVVLNNNDQIIPTGRKGIPYMYGNIPVLANLRVAEALLDRGHDGDIAMIMLFDGSLIKSGISRKNKPYSLLKVDLSDGFSSLEATWWDKKNALRLPINSVVLIHGTLKAGWKQPVSITLKGLERIV